jgi:hypothetical protein
LRDAFGGERRSGTGRPQPPYCIAPEEQLLSRLDAGLAVGIIIAGLSGQSEVLYI